MGIEAEAILSDYAKSVRDTFADAFNEGYKLGLKAIGTEDNINN